MSRRRYRVFISYSHHDKPWGEWLHGALERYRVPRRLVGRNTEVGWIPQRLGPVFRDQDELPSASDLGREVSDTLASSDNLIVVCSPAAVASRWVEQEILAFKRLGRGDRIFCLIVGGEPNATARPGHEAEECFPAALRFALDAEGNPDPAIPVEPIAADVREDREGKGVALVKLVAGLLGIGVDDLRQREQVRKYRRTTMITGLSVVVAAVMAVLGVQAILARQAAERRQQQAEALVGYMLGDLAARLGEVNRLDILAGVTDRAMQYFEALPARDLSETGLDQRVLALQKIGSVRLDQGQADSARQAFDAALALSQRLARRSPDSLARQLAYADSLNWIGYADWQQGRTDDAAAHFAAAHAVLVANRDRAPDSPLMLTRIKDVATNNGQVQQARGKLDAAEGNYLEALDAVRRLQRLQPDKPEWEIELGYAYNNLGLLAETRGQLRKAVGFYASDLELKRAQAAREPRNDEFKHAMAVALMFLSRLHGQLGETTRAITEQEQAVAVYQRLQAADPGNAGNSYYLGLARLGLARLLLDAGRLEAAVDQAAQAQALLRHAADSDAGNPKKAMRAIQARLLIGQAALQRGQRDQAVAIATEVQLGLAALQPGDADLAEQAKYRALAALLLAQASPPGRPGLVRERLHQAQALLQDQVNATTRDPALLDTWLRIAAALHSQPFPQRELTVLADAGYASPGFVAAMRATGIAYRPVAAPAAVAAD